MKKYDKKILFLVNDLSFFCSHRLPIAEAMRSKGFEVLIAYGEHGKVDKKSIEFNLGNNLILIFLYFFNSFGIVVLP